DRSHLARDVVGLPHLWGDGWRVVPVPRVRIVPAVHHDTAEGEVDEVTTEEVGPGTVVAERHDARHDEARVVAGQIVVADPSRVQVTTWAGVEHDVGLGRQPTERSLAVNSV